MVRIRDSSNIWGKRCYQYGQEIEDKQCGSIKIMASILDNFIYFLATVAYANFDGFAESYNYNGKLHGKSEGCRWLRERVHRSPQVQVVCDQCL